MKLKQLLSGVLMAGLLFSCNEQEEPSLAGSASEQVKPSLNLNLVAEVPADGMRALEFDITERGPKIKRQASSFDTHAYFRKKSNPELLGYAKLTWDIVEDEGAVVKLRLNNGENLQVYAVEGMEHIERGVTLLNPQPELGSDWYICGLAAVAPLNEGQEEALKGQFYGRAHIAFGWTQLKDSPMIVKFLPQGVLLRVEVKNASSRRLEASEVRVESNAVGFTDIYLTKEYYSPEQLEQGTVGHARIGTTNPNIKIYGVRGELSALEPGETASALVWGKSVDVGNAKTRVYIDNLQAKRLGTTTPFESTAVLKDGQTKLLRVEFGDEQFRYTHATGRSPFARLTRSAISNNLNRFTSLGKSLGYYTFEQVSTTFQNPVTVDGKKYYLPTREEWVVFVPEIKNLPSGTKMSFTAPVDISSLKETAQFGSQSTPKEFTSQYKGAGTGDYVYGIRFEDATNDHRAAYRYTRLDGGMMIVDAITIGNDMSITLDKIANPTWWEGKNFESVRLPAYGVINNADAKMNHVGWHGAYWSSTPSGPNQASIAEYWGSDFRVRAVSKTTWSRPVLLMLDDRTMPSGVSSEASDWADGGEG